ncbi:MAG: response regulator [Thermoplasmatota archaeon]
MEGAAGRLELETRPVVLLVDDEPDVCESLADLLSAFFDPIRVVTADSGAAALAVLAREPIDLIVTDYRMPGMDGLSLLAEVRRRWPAVPRVLITAFPDPEIGMRATDVEHVRRFMTKPIEPREVISAVRDALASPA